MVKRMDAGPRPEGERSRLRVWRTSRTLSLFSAILLGAFSVGSVMMIWLIQTRIYAVKQHQLVDAVDSAAEGIRLRMDGNRDYLLMLAQERGLGIMDLQSFQSRASRYVADHPEMICVTWVDANYVIKDVAPIAPNKQVVDLPLVLPEPKRASRLARDRRKPVYTHPFEVIQGAVAFELWVPVFHDEKFLGLLGGVFSCENILRNLIPPQRLGAYRASLTDAAGRSFLTLPALGPVDEKLRCQVSLGLSEPSLSLQFRGYGTGILGQHLLLLECLCLIFASGTVYAMWRLKREIGSGQRAAEEKEKLQTLLLQAQKMESVGRLAGGVAHDFNNLLMGIMGYAELCGDQLPEGHPGRRYLDEITKASQRSADLIRQLLAFASKQVITPKVINLNVTVEGMLHLLRQLVGEDIEMAWMPGATLWPVKLDPSQVDQILANLCVNARDAIDGVGNLTLRTANHTVDRRDRADPGGGTPGDYVQLMVSDTGKGMNKEVLDHIFEPFFTTKGIGEGTGLGLATVYGIVKQNDGFIEVISSPGKGTTFKIYLPRCAGDPETVAEADVPPPPRACGETVLVVEDDKLLRETCGEFLDTLGYKTVVAESPAAASTLVACHSGDIDLLVTDVIMPGLNGRDLADRIRVLKPGIKVLYMSGFTAEIIAQRGVLDDGIQFIQKPFSRDDIARKVREVLERGD